MLKRFDFVAGAIAATDENIDRMLVYSAPDATEIAELEGKYGINRYAIGSSLDPEELGRIDKFKDHWAFILKSPCNFTAEDRLLFTVTSIGLFLFKDVLVIITPEPFNMNDYKQAHEVKNARDAFLAILYGSAIHFMSHIKVITKISDSLEKRISTSMENHYLLNMFSLEKSLVFFSNGIESNTIVIESIKESAPKIRFSASQLKTLDEIVIESHQCERQAEIYTRILTGLMDARSSIVNNNLNILIKRLTIVSVVFMPLNVLAGMGGMSEYTAWTAGIPWWISFPSFLAALSVIGLVSYRVLIKSSANAASPKEKKRLRQ